jgi:PAS domain S-box-containing protein
MDGNPQHEPAPTAEPPAAPRSPEALNGSAAAFLHHYQQLFAFLPDGFLLTDLSGNILEANHMALRLLRQPREFVVGKPLPFLVAHPQRFYFYTLLNNLRTGARAEPVWETCLRPPGQERDVPVEMTISYLSDDEGRLTHLLWGVRDVSARKDIEQRLRAEHQLVEGLVTTAKVIFLLLDPEGHILRHNAYLEDLSGLDAAELRGRVWWDCLLPAEARAPAQSWFRQAFVGTHKAYTVQPLLTAAGDRRTVAWYGAELAATPDAGATVLLVGHDVTELHAAQQQALQAERLAAIGKMAAAIAHDGRNAIQRTHACLERLSWKIPDRPEALELVARAQKAQDDLLRLFEDVRSFAAPIRLEAGWCNVAEVWREAWARLTTAHPDRSARLDEQLGETDLFCWVDRFRLGQVLYNILDNALAAGPDQVVITVTTQEASLAGRPAVLVIVRDNGPGLNAEQRQHIFEPFYTTKVKGTGLGMAIAKRIIDAYGGQITVGPGGPGAELLIILPRSGSHGSLPADHHRG